MKFIKLVKARNAHEQLGSSQEVLDILDKKIADCLKDMRGAA